MFFFNFTILKIKNNIFTKFIIQNEIDDFTKFSLK